MDKNKLQLFAGGLIMESSYPSHIKKQFLNFIEEEANKHQIMAILLDGEITDIDEDAKQIIEDRYYTNEISNVVDESFSDVMKLFKKAAAAAPGKAGEAIGKGITKGTGGIVKGAGKAIKGAVGAVAKGAGAYSSVIKGIQKGGGGGATGTLLAGAAIYISTMAAWRGIQSLKQREKAKCAVKMGNARKACLAGAEAQIIEKKMRILNNLKSKCSKSVSPESCEAGIQDEINHLELKLTKHKYTQSKILAK